MSARCCASYRLTTIFTLLSIYYLSIFAYHIYYLLLMSNFVMYICLWENGITCAALFFLGACHSCTLRVHTFVCGLNVVLEFSMICMQFCEYCYFAAIDKSKSWVNFSKGSVMPLAAMCLDWNPWNLVVFTVFFRWGLIPIASLFHATTAMIKSWSFLHHSPYFLHMSYAANLLDSASNRT